MNLNKYIKEAMRNVGGSGYIFESPISGSEQTLMSMTLHKKIIEKALTAYRDDVVERLTAHVKQGNIDMVHLNLDKLIKELTNDV